MAIKGTARIRLVKGEAYSFGLYIEGENLEIKRVAITSRELGFCHDLQLLDGKWVYVFLKNETQNWPAGVATFSITIESERREIDPQILPRQIIEVLPNDNPATEVSNGL